MKTSNFIKTLRWMRNHKKLIIFVITMILIAILASCMGVRAQAPRSPWECSSPALRKANTSLTAP